MVYKQTTQQDYVFTDIIKDSLIAKKNENKYLIYDNDLSIKDLMGDSPVIYHAPNWNHELINADLGFNPYIDKNVLHEDILAILPIYGYIHSGASINAGYNRYHCVWDSGLIGYAYITQDMAKEHGLDITNVEELENIIISTTDCIDKIYEGDVYSVVCEYLDNDNVVIDYETYGGIIGYDHALKVLKEDF